LANGAAPLLRAATNAVSKAEARRPAPALQKTGDTDPDAVASKSASNWNPEPKTFR